MLHLASTEGFKSSKPQNVPHDCCSEREFIKGNDSQCIQNINSPESNASLSSTYNGNELDESC